MTASSNGRTLPSCYSNHARAVPRKSCAVPHQSTRPRNQFTIYAHPQGGYEAVKHDWTACSFGPWRALTKKMRALVLGVLGLSVVLWVIVATSIGMEKAKLIINVGSIVTHVVFGAYGNQWRMIHLESRGFGFKATVTAANGKGAIELYMKRSAEPQRSRPSRLESHAA
jgi:hypothetical protein